MSIWSYAFPIVQLLDSHASAEELADHLTKISTENMGLQPNRERDLEISAELVLFWSDWKKD
jgi:hypothetical protein